MKDKVPRMGKIHQRAKDIALANARAGFSGATVLFKYAELGKTPDTLSPNKNHSGKKIETNFRGIEVDILPAKESFGSK